MSSPATLPPRLCVVPQEPVAPPSAAERRLEDALWRRLDGYDWVVRVEVAEEGPRLRATDPPSSTHLTRRVRLPSLPVWVRVSWSGSEPWRKDIVDLAVAAAELTLREEDLLEERTALWERFESLRQQTAERQRMSAIGTMAAGVAHDIRNPLSVLVGNVAYLEELVAQVPGAKEEVAAISADNRMALELIEGVLDSMRTFVQMKEASSVLSVEPVLQCAVRLAQWHFTRARARVELRVVGDPTIRATAGELSQIMMNLLSNAAAASPEGRAVRVAAAQKGAYTHVWVADEGSGVAMDQAEAIFEPFHTSKSKGLGLGLSVAREMAERHGGTLRLIATPPPELGPEKPKGACFELVLQSGSGG